MSKKGEQHFQHLKELIEVFRGDEMRVAEIYIGSLTSKKQKVNEAALQLFKEVKKKRTTYTSLTKKLDLTGIPISFDTLLEKVVEQARESLILRANVEKEGHYSDLFKIRFRLKKELSGAYILLGRMLNKQAIRMLDKIIEKSQEYELYDITFEALTRKMILTSNTNPVDYNKTILDLNNIRKRMMLFSEANELYHSVYANRLNKVEKAEFSIEKIDRIKKIAEEINSINIWSYYYLLQIDAHTFQNNKDKIIFYISELLTILKKSPIINSASRITYMFTRKAEVEFFSLKFHDAIISHTSSRGFCKSFSFAALLNESNMMKPLIYMKQYGSAFDVSNLLKKHKVDIKYPIQYLFSVYRRAVIYFLSNKYLQALKMLSKKNDLEKDKEGFNVWIRVMRILCQIELNQLEMIDYDIENFRKYLERTSKEYEVRERDQLVLKALIELNRQSFDFHRTAEKRKGELDKLSSADRQYAWDPKSAEMVLFHEWFQSKLTGKEYSPNFDVYRKAWYPEIDYTGQDELPEGFVA